MELFHLIVYAPLTHADAVRDALALSGAGKIGNYDSCSFSAKGIGRFRPLKGSKPAIGEEGKLETVDEERIEAVVKNDENLKNILQAIQAAHPYEEPAIHLLPMEEYQKFL